MNRDEVKLILALYRPWADDANAPEFAGAIAATKQDAELREWFERHCAGHQAIRASLKRIAAPAGLKEQIISERRAALAAEGWRRRSVVAGVVCAVAMLVLVTFKFIEPGSGRSEMSYESYRTRMVKTAMRNYGMDLETNDVRVITNYLAQHQGHADYQLPPPLANATNTGCGVLTWQGHPVSMVCFHSGRPLPPGQKTDLFLFVIPSNVATSPPAADQPQFAHVNTFTTASWMHDGLIYLLATPGDEAFLRKFL